MKKKSIKVNKEAVFKSLCKAQGLNPDDCKDETAVNIAVNFLMSKDKAYRSICLAKFRGCFE